MASLDGPAAGSAPRARGSRGRAHHIGRRKSPARPRHGTTCRAGRFPSPVASGDWRLRLRPAPRFPVAPFASLMPGKQFLEQVDEAGPRPLFGELVVADALDLEMVRVGVGEAVSDIPVAMDLPVGPGIA